MQKTEEDQRQMRHGNINYYHNINSYNLNIHNIKNEGCYNITRSSFFCPYNSNIYHTVIRNFDGSSSQYIIFRSSGVDGVIDMYTSDPLW